MSGTALTDWLSVNCSPAGVVPFAFAVTVMVPVNLGAPDHRFASHVPGN
jgi:hypothetical protein